MIEREPEAKCDACGTIVKLSQALNNWIVGTHLKGCCPCGHVLTFSKKEKNDAIQKERRS